MSKPIPSTPLASSIASNNELRDSRAQLLIWYSQLKDKKFIVRRKYTLIVQVDEFKWNTAGINAKITTLKVINQHSERSPKRWKEKNAECTSLDVLWGEMTAEALHHKIIFSDGNATMWLEPTFVNYIDKLIEYGDIDDALELLAL